MIPAMRPTTLSSSSTASQYLPSQTSKALFFSGESKLPFISYFLNGYSHFLLQLQFANIRNFYKVLLVDNFVSNLLDRGMGSYNKRINFVTRLGLIGITNET